VHYSLCPVSRSNPTARLNHANVPKIASTIMEHNREQQALDVQHRRFGLFVRLKSRLL
jgi:hypothetical protein